jgi:hypothetical protein
MKIAYEILIISILFFCICFIYKDQPRNTINEGKGHDGTWYYNIAEQVQQGVVPVVGEKPFIKRIGNFFLIGKFSKYSGSNLLDSALYVNLFGALITAILLIFWLRIFINTFWVRSLLIFLFMMAWFVPLRGSFFMPMGSDSWGGAWFVGGLLLLNNVRKSYDSNHRLFWKILSGERWYFV